MGNQALQNLFPNLEVEHLTKQGSDLSPLILTTKSEDRPNRKTFRFLIFWVEHETLQKLVEDNWQEVHSSDLLFNFRNKLKKVSRALSKWSRDTYADIFKQIATLEEVVQVHEKKFETHPTKTNRENSRRYKQI